MNPRIEKIKELYGELETLRLNDDCHYRFKKIVEHMMEEVDALFAEDEEILRKNQYKVASNYLSDTYRIEVASIKDKEDAMHKPNAAKVRRTEYKEAVTKALNRVYNDIFSIIKS